MGERGQGEPGLDAPAKGSCFVTCCGPLPRSEPARSRRARRSERPPRGASGATRTRGSRWRSCSPARAGPEGHLHPLDAGDGALGRAAQRRHEARGHRSFCRIVCAKLANSSWKSVSRSGCPAPSAARDGDPLVPAPGGSSPRYRQASIAARPARGWRCPRGPSSSLTPRRHSTTARDRNSAFSWPDRRAGHARLCRSIQSGIRHDALRVAANRLEPPPVLANLATLLQAMHDAVQARRVNLERLAGLGDRDARPLADQREQLLVAPARCCASRGARRGRCAVILRGRGAAATSRRSRRAVGRRRLAPACPRGARG
jgi:hypothetical protein